MEEFEADSQEASWREARRTKKTEKREQRKAERAADLELYGPEVAMEVLGTTLVTIFANGYVRVGGLMRMRGGGKPERLLEIDGSAEVTKKSGLGRAVVAVATAGANIGASPNRRGDLYLTIVSDLDVYQIHVEPPTDKDMKAMKKLEMAGKGVIRAGQSASSAEHAPAATASATPEPPDVADQFERLAALHRSGALTDEEYAGAKQRLLNG